MRNAIAGLMAAMLALGFADAASAHGYKRKNIEIVHPWTADKPQPGGRDAIVSMDIKNAGASADRLVGATSAIAERVELATGSAAKAIEVAPRGRVDLTAKTQHLRLVGLKKRLTAYDTLPVTLVFERAGRIRIDVLVEESGN
jgi:periplasmic copper chaperone A